MADRERFWLFPTLLLLASQPYLATAEATPARPNILLIYADDKYYDSCEVLDAGTNITIKTQIQPHLQITGNCERSSGIQ